jgi:aspartokinase-like uncharacterized kinase
MRTGVLKIGGASVFSSGTPSDPLRHFIQSIQTDNSRRWFVILGGGDTVESMRTLHRHHPQLDTQRMHWRCVELLRATSDAARELFSFEHFLETPKALAQAILDPTPRCYLVEVSTYYHRETLDWIPIELRPVESWDTTSDTLAWLLALQLRADELHLLKKPDCSSIQTLEQAARIGLVDPQIETLAKNRPVDWQLDTYLVYHTTDWNQKLLARPPALPSGKS